RRVGRWTLLSSLLGMFVLAGGVEASTAAPFIEKVTPNHGCPGEKVTFTGSGFAVGDEAMWKDVSVTPNNAKTPTTFISSKEITSYIPIFLVAGTAEQNGTVKIQFNNQQSNEKAFTFTPLPEACFGKGGGGGEKGATGAT